MPPPRRRAAARSATGCLRLVVTFHVDHYVHEALRAGLVGGV
ncbi:hypothetical protein [Actinosynnema sp.]